MNRPLVEIFCACTPEVAYEREVTRERHFVHHDGTLRPYEEPTANMLRPLALGGPVLEVDTTVEVDVAAVAEWVRAQREWRLAAPGSQR